MEKITVNNHGLKFSVVKGPRHADLRYRFSMHVQYTEDKQWELMIFLVNTAENQEYLWVSRGKDVYKLLQFIMELSVKIALCIKKRNNFELTLKGEKKYSKGEKAWELDRCAATYSFGLVSSLKGINSLFMSTLEDRLEGKIKNDPPLMSGIPFLNMTVALQFMIAAKALSFSGGQKSFELAMRNCSKFIELVGDKNVVSNAKTSL